MLAGELDDAVGERFVGHLRAAVSSSGVGNFPRARARKQTRKLRNTTQRAVKTQVSRYDRVRGLGWKANPATPRNTPQCGV
jgi:hypothetical protein